MSMPRPNKKQTRIIKKALPEIFGKTRTEVYTNYVEFSIPAEAFKVIRGWLDRHETLEVSTIGRDEHLRLVIINLEEQTLYEKRGHRGNRTKGPDPIN